MSSRISAPAALAFAPSPLGILSGNRAEHDHAVAKTQLSVRDRAVRIGVDGVPLETKGRTQPFNRGRRVPVAKGGNDCRLRALGKGRHAVVLCLVDQSAK